MLLFYLFRPTAPSRKGTPHSRSF